ncbi:MAG: hypothetical protein LC635_00385 [Pseudonocardiaceae bacterium]|nr:hypothetical protein [Pseudonocardiaceae bacterium]
MLFADYLATARGAFTPGTQVSPAWVREVTGCSRGLSSRLAAALRAETDQAPTNPYQPRPAQRAGGTDPSTEHDTTDQDAAAEAGERAA